MTSGQVDEISTAATPRPDQGRERRTTLRALKAWTDAREGNEIPDFAGLTGILDMAGEHEVFTENQFLIMIEAYSTTPVVIFYGSELPNMLAPRHVGHSLQRILPAALRDIFHEACGEAADNGDVVHRHGMIGTPSGADVLYRGIFMPLRSASHPDRIYVFGAFSNEDGGAELLAAA